KTTIGWQPHHKIWHSDSGEVVAAAMVLERTIPLPGMSAQLRMHYTPKGPILADWDDPDLRQRVLKDLQSFAEQRRAFFLKIDPDVALGTGIPGEQDSQADPSGEKITSELKLASWRFSNEQIQFRNTVMIDLSPTEEDLLAQMKQKTRYNIRLAGRKGVEVRVGTPADFDALYQIYAETAVRDNFTIRNKNYYLNLWESFSQAGNLFPLIAEVENQMVAGVMLFVYGGRAWYLYGMSRNVHRNKMPTYLLQWEAIRLAKKKGCTDYDLWGAPDKFDPESSMWGVFRFKRGLGGQVVRTIGAWDYPLRPWLYGLYTKALPRVLSVMRKRGNAQTQSNISRD
ncbi:MAG: peptidoglycan bridge formation glycyltransferase FemA/FemB family protein, partial [Chloroflexota bacterium]